ncbi:uncharacterized protein B0T15DRAFT_66470 [Chaetomium strumarium]|uniref:RING-type domain-containing protein n=1 Tax=Chaetomium strumarium TaxID=1170767 RepID=A0AAJ0M705_9PEZI|nr:hypothetical protein B0T15DRAFT_66470 [Chaetomium strumarium]
MGNNSSRSTLPGHRGPAEAKTSMSPIRSSHPVEKPPSDPLTPEKPSRTAYEPLTPPPSGSSNSKRPSFPDHDFSFPFNPTTPPASSDHSATPALTFASTIQTPSASSPISPDINRYQHASTPCSNCYRPIIRHHHHHHHHSPPLSRTPASKPLKCGHRLCKRCIRTSLLASLSTDPFTPASCPGCRSCSTKSTTTATLRGSDDDDDNNNSNNKQKEDMANEATATTTTTTIPLAVLGSAATAAEFLAYRDKLRERRTPVERRLYCHDREGCGMFLASSEARIVTAGPRKGRESSKAGAVLCPLCQGKTCRGCGMRSHWFGGKSDTMLQEDGMGRKRRGERSLSKGGRKRRKCGSERKGKGEGERC